MGTLDRIGELMGAASIALALLAFSHRLWFLSRAVATEGQVVACPEYNDKGDTDGGPPFGIFYGATVVFRDRAGCRIEFESGVHSYPARRYYGDVVRVLYDPSKPERAFIGEPLELWAMPVFFIIFGSYFLREQIGAMFG